MIHNKVEYELLSSKLSLTLKNISHVRTDWNIRRNTEKAEIISNFSGCEDVTILGYLPSSLPFHSLVAKI